ncbi:MAG: EscU/YscU/HrcU family type III secretion system export apparatus switch protein [Alphaproteobacteria bacterium]|nr:EscU/YscU/HrcU family type III secretion system export apparatus switch protein [Alphaproteobacteria bacterium]
MPRSSERSVQAPATRSGVPGSPERVPVAIALSYERGKDPAPRVVASGRGAVAEQILEIAFAAGIKVREDADLAEVLATVELDSVIPLEAFAAVAEIVAYLYRANARLAGDDVAAAFPTGKPATMLVR